MRETMKLINLLLLLLPLTAYSQVDSIIFGDNLFVGEKLYVKDRPKPTLYKLKPDTLPSGGITAQHLEYYDETSWIQSRFSTETKKGTVKIPVQVMDSGIKVEVFETRDTLYKCPVSNMVYFTYDYNVSNKKDVSNCMLDKVVTCRTYRFYIINEEGKKEYLELDISKNK